MSGKTMWAILHRLARNQMGGTLALTAVVFPAVIGFSGLALDGAHWYAQRRSTQSMVDAAAVAGAYARLEQKPDGIVDAVVRTEAVRNGFEPLPANNLIVKPLSSSIDPGTTALVDATISRQVPLYFAGLLIPGTHIPISARAVAGVRNLGPQCIIALNETAARAVEFTGSTTADIGCGVASNSDSDEALFIGGSAVLMANPAQAFGDVAIEGSGELISQLPPLPFSPRVPDPFESLSVPPLSSCDQSGSGNKGVQINDGSQLVDVDGDGLITLCGGVDFSGNITLPSATYVIRNGDISTGGNTDISGDQLSFILTGDQPGDVGRVALNNNTEMQLSAPQSGPYQGVLFFQDQKALSPDRSLFNGGADLQLDGAIYMPRSLVEFSGGSSNPDHCLQIVSDRVTFTGNSFIRNDPAVCADLGLILGGTTQKQVVLLE
ncbi:pilus assembly protein TadG-related protein [Iodidimonas sp. MBR-14]|uniref:TadE/TadG family type IV pilus assembly protein n=2 Tax=Iodidimonas TaxID=2066486 RepID=UPI0024822A32|nr:pilus assembly protein TadG-related protein [Iodidimonas sp. MBR-14]